MAYSATAQKGGSILVQKGATTIGGFRTTSFAINSETVDVTTVDATNRWRQLLGAASIKSMSISGSGVVKDTAAQQAMVTDVIAQTLDTYTLTMPGIGAFTGSYQLTAFSGAGEYNGEVTFDITLESAGDITFTAEG